MDELDILKKDWNTSSSEHKKLSVKDIYPMLHKKSSSIVKTLFYISIAELVFWSLVNAIPYFYSDEYRQKLEAIYTNEYILTTLTVVSYAIILLFIYLLYKSYQSISVTDNAKKLMESIIKTRKIIKYYVLFNLIMIGVSMITASYYAVHNDPETIKGIESIGENGLIIYLVIIVVLSILLIVVFWFFYKLIYGLLLKRLNRNYKELKKLEV
tara:strand:- start:1818 stop:2453 length:636 start_codon:yes stop_codon:yes gene_type:complete